MDKYTLAELEIIYDNSGDDQKQWLLDHIDGWFNK